MRKILSAVFFVLAPLLLLGAAYTTSVSALQSTQAPLLTSANTSPRPTTVKGTVMYREFAALAADAQVTVRLVDISRADGTEIVLGEQAIASAGRPVPLEFEVVYDPVSIRPEGVYVAVANMVVGGELVYWTAARRGVITQGLPTPVQLVLSKIGPWSPFDLAVSSGRLARHSY